MDHDPIIDLALPRSELLNLMRAAGTEAVSRLMVGCTNDDERVSGLRINGGPPLVSMAHFACAIADKVLLDACLDEFGFKLCTEAASFGTPLHCAAARGNIDFLKPLLHHATAPPIDQPICSYGSRTMLEIVVESKLPVARKCEAIAVLVAAGAQLNLRDSGECNGKRAILDRIVSNGDLEVARWLVKQYGADAVQRKSDTNQDLQPWSSVICQDVKNPARLADLLHLAAGSHVVGMLTFIVEDVGASINQIKDGWSVLMRIVMQRSKCDDAVEMLREAMNLGADVNLPNSSGQTPLDKAREIGNVDAASVLSGEPDPRSQREPSLLDQLLDMGFTRDKAERALTLASGDIQSAIAALVVQ